MLEKTIAIAIGGTTGLVIGAIIVVPFLLLAWDIRQTRKEVNELANQPTWEDVIRDLEETSRNMEAVGNDMEEIIKLLNSRE
jgi:hypothetical protein